MSERYSILRPLTIEELEMFTFELLNFFSPMKVNEIRSLLGKTIEENKIIPLSVNDFYKYMEKIRGVRDINRYHYHLLLIIKKLEQANYLCYAGNDIGFNMGGEKCYYIKEYTNLQERNPLWIGECLGLEYVQHKVKNYIVAGRVICGCCGKGYGRKVWNSSDERLRRIIWRCNSKYDVKGKIGCESRHIDDSMLYKAFVSVFNAVLENRDYFMSKWNGQIAEEDILRRVTAKRFIAVFQAANSIESFDTDLYFKVVEKITACEDRVVVSLLDGTEIECEVE